MRVSTKVENHHLPLSVFYNFSVTLVMGKKRPHSLVNLVSIGKQFIHILEPLEILARVIDAVVRR